MFTEPVSFLDIVLEETGSFRSQSRGRLHRSAGREFQHSDDLVPRKRFRLHQMSYRMCFVPQKRFR